MPNQQLLRLNVSELVERFWFVDQIGWSSEQESVAGHHHGANQNGDISRSRFASQPANVGVAEAVIRG